MLSAEYLPVKDVSSLLSSLRGQAKSFGIWLNLSIVSIHLKPGNCWACVEMLGSGNQGRLREPEALGVRSGTLHLLSSSDGSVAP